MGTKLYRLLALIALLAAPVRASAYYLETRGDSADPIHYADGDESTPETIDVEFRINASTFPEGLDGEVAIAAAFQAWTDAGCAAVAFTAGTPSESIATDHWRTDDGDVYVLVYFSDTDEEWYSGPAVGHFYYGFNPQGRLIGATVVLNARDHEWATDGSDDALDLQGVVTALIGRSMGITSAIENNATFPRYAPGDTSKRMLGSDDLAAIQFLYPAGGECAEAAPPQEICSGVTLPGEEPCPPRPETMPGDGGTIDPRDDAGSVPGPQDAGADGGTRESRSGCSASAGGSRTGCLAWFLVIAIGVLVRGGRARRR